MNKAKLNVAVKIFFCLGSGRYFRAIPQCNTFTNQVSSSVSLFRWRLMTTRTMKRPWMLCPRRSSASPKRKILHPPNKKRDLLTCSTKSPSSRSLSKLAGEEHKSHSHCCALLLNVSRQRPRRTVSSLDLLLSLAGCMRRTQLRLCGCARPYWTSQSWTLLSGSETRTASWWNTTASRATSKW